jgi:lipoprotein-anchoring transpeptidase ErfK/SrfK
MTTPLQEARSATDKARLALRNGDRRQARLWAERAAKLAPNLEDPWLILAALAGPREGLEYIRKALQVNPQSPRAQRGMEWVMQHLGDTPRAAEKIEQSAVLKPTPAGPVPAAPSQTAPKQKQHRRGPLLAITLLVAGCAILAFAGWTAMTSPVVASMLPQPILESQPTPAPEWAQVSIPKPTYTGEAFVQVPPPTATPTAMPTATATPQDSTVFTDLSTVLPTDSPTATDEVAPVESGLPTAEPQLPTTEPQLPTTEPPLPTTEPEGTGELSLEYVQDTPTAEAPPYVLPTAIPPVPGGSSDGVHWIDVNLSQQMLYAYAGDTIVNSFVVSTGTWLTPTVTGKFKVWVKLRSSDMSGADYYLPAVPYVMYFFKDYGIHGTYWHNNFGTPMSHGCVNMSIPDAEWIYNFSTVGTVVNVHY